MRTFSSIPTSRPPQQQAIWAKCVHPTGTFAEFKKEWIEQSVPERFEAQVRRYPDRLAVKGKGKDNQLTYDQLNQFANRVAGTVLARRIEGEEPVALLLETGVSVIGAILGVLKAGKSYVHMDPSHPTDRISHILEDSQTRLILTNSKQLPLACKMAEDRVQLVDVDNLDLKLSSENLGLSILPDTVAYILYTSGSTGLAKGVIHNHRNVLHMIMNHTNLYHICADDRIGLFYSPGAIGAGRDIFGALLNGAAVFPFDVKEEGVGQMASWVMQEELTICRMAATVFRHFGGTLTGGKQLPSLRLLQVGNETVNRKDVDLYKKHLSQNCIFAAGLGATEISPIRMFFMDMETQITTSTIPCGYAIDGVEVLLLDDAGQDVGFNQIGEIAIRSRFLSQGYWRLPDLTNEKFLLDSSESDKKVYLTGDLGRMSPDGCLEHLGRKDFQVKIRGYKVDIAAVEVELLDQPEVKEAVVTALPDQSGNNRLVAYLVPANESAPTVSALQSALFQSLPDYMVPTAFVMMDALPQTPNGKLDRMALPAPGTARPELESKFVAPRTQVEKTLTRIWCEVLGLDRVGVHDSFLELGGDSLLVTQVISRVINSFQVDLQVRRLLESPSVADMALVITECLLERSGPGDVDRMLADLEALSDQQAKQLLGLENG